MPVSIRNTTSQIQVFNLVHPALRTDESVFGYRSIVVGTVEEDHKTGVRRAKATRKHAPASITFLGQETRAKLPLVLLQCPEINAAIWPKDGAAPRLRIMEQTPDDAPAPASTEETPVVEEKSEEAPKKLKKRKASHLGEDAEVLTDPAPHGEGFVDINEPKPSKV